MNKNAAVFVSLLALPALAAVDPAKDVWFHADLDSPARIQGEAFLVSMNQAGETSGRFGKGYHFYRETNNKLPPMDQFFANQENFIVTPPAKLTRFNTSAKFSGGTFEVAPRQTFIGYHWVGHDAGNTWSFYVKGRKGGKVTLYPYLTELTPAARKACAKAHPLDKEVVDVCVTNTVELTGEWQRVWCHVVTDNRTAGRRKSALVVKTDCPVELERFQMQVTGVYPYKGQFSPSMWIDGGRSSRGTVYTSADQGILKSFPFKAGTIAFWIKNGPSVPSKDALHIFSFTKTWSSEWFLRGGSFKAGNGGSMLHFKTPIPRKDEWTHVAVSWRDGRIAYYLNGVLDSEIKDDPKKNRVVKCVPMEKNQGRFRFGSACDGTGPTDAVFDEMSVFNRTLDDAEIAELAQRNSGLYQGSKEILAENILFTVFFRDQKDAVLRFRVIAPEGGEYDLLSEVGGLKSLVLKRSIPAGESYFEVPLEPARLRPGKYPYTFQLFKNDAVALERKGEIEIKGRLGLEGDPLIFMSWGGSGNISPDFLKSIGVNAYNIGVDNPLEVRRSLVKGMFANIRYENGGQWFTDDFDMLKIKNTAKKRLMPYAKLPNWRTMLLNSEIYGSGVAKCAQENPKYLRMVEKAIGVKPNFTYKDAPSEVDWNALGVPPPRGEIERGKYPALSTLEYVCSRGLPPVITNYKTTEAVHELKSDVLVWSEPCFGALFDSVDMGADWEYEYSSGTTLRQLRMHYAGCRTYKRPYQPTLGGCYWPVQHGRHPVLKEKNGKPKTVAMAQGTDEVTIKTWLSMAAIPMHNLSWFALDAWQYGQQNAKKYLESTTNDVKSIAEPDCAEVYGRRWRETLHPAALLLRDMPNEKAKIAVLNLPEICFAAGFWWGHHHYNTRISGVLAKHSASFDFIGSEEIKNGFADDYDYIVCLMSRVIYKDHAQALRKLASKGVKIVLDSYATNRYDNCVYLKDLKYQPGAWGVMEATFSSWYTNVVDSLAEKAFASSPATDGNGSYTFTKEYKGAKYVVVVNNKRSEKPTFHNIFKTNDWYRVVGAPQKIRTRISAPQGSVIYGFNGAKAPNEEYAAAEGRIYAVYPKALKAPALSLGGRAKPGCSVKLIVKINDKDGAPAPGRQIVRLTFADNEGGVRDESGLYVVEDGFAEITLRIPACEKPTGFFSKWKAQVEDLTTGKKDSIRISIVK